MENGTAFIWLLAPLAFGCARDGRSSRIRALTAEEVDRSPRIAVEVDSVFDRGQRSRTLLLTRVAGIQALSGGRVAVADEASSHVQVVDSTGAVIARIGRAGKGPGEFVFISLVTSDSDSLITLFDAAQRRITTLNPNGSVAGLYPLPFLGVRPRFAYADGSLLLEIPGVPPEPTRSGTVRDSVSLVRWSNTKGMLHRYGSFAGDDRVLRLRSNGSLTGGSPPIRRQLLVAANNRLVCTTENNRFHVDCFDEGGGRGPSIRVNHRERPVEEWMKRDARERVRPFMQDPYGKDEWTRLTADDVFPIHVPPTDALLVDRDGYIWARDFTLPSTAEARWLIFRDDGSLVGQLRLPTAFELSDIRGQRLVGWRLNADEIPTLEVYRLRAALSPVRSGES